MSESAEDLPGVDPTDNGITLDPDLTAENATKICTNVYCVSDEEYLDMIYQFIYPNSFEWGLIICYILVFIVGLIGNFLVIYVVWYDRRMRTITNLFIVNLSVADFFVLLICMPTTVMGDVTETWYLGGTLCKIIQYLQSVSVSVSVLTLTVISIERFFAICFPLRVRTTVGTARIMIAGVWVISCMIFFPEVVVLDIHRKFDYRLTNLLTTCKPTWPYHYQATKCKDYVNSFNPNYAIGRRTHSVSFLAGYQLFQIVALFVIPIVVMGTSYATIATFLWSSKIPTETMRLESYTSRRQSEGTSEHNASPDSRPILVARRNAAKMLIAVVIMFGICYFPVHLLNILRYVQVGLDDNFASMFALIAHWLCYFNSAINPVIYNFMSEKFRTAFTNALSCRLSKMIQTSTLKKTFRRTAPSQNTLNNHVTAV